MRLPRLAAVASRPAPAGAAPPSSSVQDTPLGRDACGVSWTLDIPHHPAPSTVPPPFSPLLSVQDTPLVRDACGVSWTLDIPHHPGATP